MDVSSHKTNCGCQKKEINMDKFVRVPLFLRGTIRSTAQALKIRKPTLFHHIKCGKICRHSNSVKQHLPIANMVEREEFCKSFIKNDKSTFDDMLDVIHVDEKMVLYDQKYKEHYLGMQKHNTKQAIIH